jgi:hypothetical protein
MGKFVWLAKNIQFPGTLRVVTEPKDPRHCKRSSKEIAGVRPTVSVKCVLMMREFSKPV